MCKAGSLGEHTTFHASGAWGEEGNTDGKAHRAQTDLQGLPGQAGELALDSTCAGEPRAALKRAVPHPARMENEEEIKAERSQTTREPAKAGGKRVGGVARLRDRDGFVDRGGEGMEERASAHHQFGGKNCPTAHVLQRSPTSSAQGLKLLSHCSTLPVVGD